ncbi:N-acetylneuraminate synthase family protein [uncultured Brevundimonas sp.]
MPLPSELTPGPDHAASLEPDEMATLVAGARRVSTSR